jgi:glycosyltransferase involved in cell wall biosynthesis
VEVSVIIPTFRRHQKLAACLRSLARQSLDAREYEVLVGFDGPDPEGVRAANAAWREAGGLHLTAMECPRAGYTATRNHIFASATGRVTVSTNDDVIAAPGFLEAHAREHRAAREGGERTIVSGASPWVVHEPDRLFDRLIRETSMVFFYDRMDTPEALADRERDWGFRHAWGLNTSAPTEVVREVGAWTVYPAWYGYEDNEIAFKIRERYGSRVIYRPEALARHDHRMSPKEYLEREFRLGFAAPGVAATTPGFAKATFNRDLTDPAELAYSREFIARERAGAARARESFERLAEMSPSLLDGPEGAALRTMLYEHHLPLKRWMWRAGFVAWHERAGADQVRWP